MAIDFVNSYKNKEALLFTGKSKINSKLRHSNVKISKRVSSSNMLPNAKKKVRNSMVSFHSVNVNNDEESNNMSEIESPMIKKISNFKINHGSDMMTQSISETLFEIIKKKNDFKDFNN